MPQAFPGLKVFRFRIKVSYSYQALRATAWIQNKKIHPPRSFKNNLFSLTLLGKKKIIMKDVPLIFFILNALVFTTS